MEALKYSNDLARDCMSYCLVSQLKSKQSNLKLKDGDTHYSQWFTALAKVIVVVIAVLLLLLLEDSVDVMIPAVTKKSVNCINTSWDMSKRWEINFSCLISGSFKILDNYYNNSNNNNKNNNKLKNVLYCSKNSKLQLWHCPFTSDVY